MSSKIKVTCSNNHRFPVNLDKNAYRDHVFCPRCRVKVVVRKKHLFSPSPSWEEEKREREAERKRIKAAGRKPTPIPMFPYVRDTFAPVLAGIFARFREAEKRRKESEQNEG